MAFDGLKRPAWVLKWLEASHGNSGNKTSLQGAHVLAKNLWNTLDIRSLIGPSDEAAVNGVFASETTLGGWLLGFGAHRGQQKKLYDLIFSRRARNAFIMAAERRWPRSR